MTRRSAPPMPRSGWMKMIVFFFAGADFLSEGEAGMIVFFFFFCRGEGGNGVVWIYDKRYVIGFNYLRERGEVESFFFYAEEVF